MIKLIASDLDGTLLQNGAKQISDRAIDLILALKEKGVRFVAASGRQYDNERILFHKIRDDISYISENGSLCYHNGQVLTRSVIDDALARRILLEIKKQDHFDVVVSREDSCFIESRNPDFVHHIRDVIRNTTTVVDDILSVEGPILKIAICNVQDGPHVIDKYLKYLQDLFAEEIKVVTSGNVWIDFIAPGTNKGVALAALIKKLGIKPEECIAFGDQYNDVEMLQFVGTGYAMSNAAPGIAYYADDVTDSVEDVMEDVLRSL